MLAALDRELGHLIDSSGVSLNTHRTRIITAFQTAWHNPTNPKRYDCSRQTLDEAFRALDNLDLVQWPDPTSAHAPLKYLCQDEDAFLPFCSANQSVIREIFALHVLMQAVHATATGQKTNAIPTFAALLAKGGKTDAEPTEFFSPEIASLYEALRRVRAMLGLGVILNNRPATLTDESERKAMKLLATDFHTPKLVPLEFSRAYIILKESFRLQPLSGQPTEMGKEKEQTSLLQIFRTLRTHIVGLHEAGLTSEPRNNRLIIFGISAMVRAMPRVGSKLARKMYLFLRSGNHIPKIRHDWMFQRMADNEDRLSLLNFLYSQSNMKDPSFFADRFSRWFEPARVDFINDRVGFAIEDQPHGTHRAKFFQAMRKSGNWMEAHTYGMG